MPAFTFHEPGAVQDVAYAIQLALGALFLVSALPKLFHPGDFRRIVAEYDVLPRLAPVVAPLVIAAETILAAAFLSGRMVQPALAFALCLVGVFAGASWLNLRRGRAIDCGCFGVANEQISDRSLVRLAVIGLGSLALLTGLLTDQVTSTTFSALREQGISSIVYLIGVGSLSLFIMIVSLWIVHARELSTAMNYGRNQP